MTDFRKLRNRIERFCANKINALAPTISPAPKSLQRNEIESIYEGFRYYYELGVSEIVVQQKYMGSYCDIYLQKNLNETYFASRNGYRVSQIDQNKAQLACQDLHKRFDWSKLQTVIIQSELMPWSVLGQSLIENDFCGYLNVHQNHYEYLSKSNLYAKIEALKQSNPYLEYMCYKSEYPEEEIKKYFSEHVVLQYETITAFKKLDLADYKKCIDVFAEQIKHFGKTGEMYFKPFNILKKIFDDGSELIVDDNMSYCEINDDKCLNLPIGNEKELNCAIEATYEWFAQIEMENKEGILIKPRKAFIKNVPPALKVRNNNYLVMIYGIDFQTDYKYHLEKRKINRKLQSSINDWMQNWELLKIKYSEINKENNFFKSLLFNRIMEEDAKVALDSRL